MLNDKDFLEKVSAHIGKDLNQMFLVERQRAINKSRNYLRFKMTKPGTCYTPAWHPLLTVKESKIIEDINRLQDQLKSLQIQFFSEFYDNCPSVGSTLKRKEKKIPGLVTLTEEEIINLL